MTKKDYILLSKWINLHWTGSVAMARLVLDNMVADLCDVLKADNPNFNRDRFIAACRKVKK